MFPTGLFFLASCSLYRKFIELFWKPLMLFSKPWLFCTCCFVLKSLPFKQIGPFTKKGFNPQEFFLQLPVSSKSNSRVLFGNNRIFLWAISTYIYVFAYVGNWLHSFINLRPLSFSTFSLQQPFIFSDILLPTRLLKSSIRTIFLLAHNDSSSGVKVSKSSFL